ncbi:MAG: Lrp/AsnC family transcriptional regulator [Candidatus Bipolaricaulota bacterium]|nr:Lrp/AsnC family transcriptional regulator [Candidatus Bipolaricaulota bacterium]MBS3792738.1 Lrp/AsnC family transcriptional regulator [Candidatus Bipolaricaulota bacterium]
MNEKKLNKEILKSFMRDGRKSIRKVARELDVSPSTVSNHLDGMIEDGIIKRFKPAVDYEKLGFDLTAITKIQAKGSKITDIVKRLKDEGSLTHVYEITGEFDILVIGKFDSRESMNKEIKRMLNFSAVERADTSIVLNAVKEDSSLELGD